MNARAGTRRARMWSIRHLALTAALLMGGINLTAQGTVRIAVPASVSFQVLDVSVVHGGGHEPELRSRSITRRCLLGQVLRISVKADGNFTPPSGSAIPASKMSWSTSNVANGVGVNGVLSADGVRPGVPVAGRRDGRRCRPELDPGSAWGPAARRKSSGGASMEARGRPSVTARRPHSRLVLHTVLDTLSRSVSRPSTFPHRQSTESLGGLVESDRARKLRSLLRHLFRPSSVKRHSPLERAATWAPAAADVERFWTIQKDEDSSPERAARSRRVGCRAPGHTRVGVSVRATVADAALAIAEADERRRSALREGNANPVSRTVRQFRRRIPIWKPPATLTGPLGCASVDRVNGVALA